MNVEKLIEEIRKFPVLYDQSNEKYRNVEYKERVWKIVANNLQIKDGVGECKKRWASIRDQLRRTLQKRKTKSGQAAKKARKYKYEDILTFLLPYLCEKESLSNVPQVDDEGDDDLDCGTNLQDISTQETYHEENASNIDKDHTESFSPGTSEVPAKKIKFASPSVTKRKFLRGEVKPEASPASQLMAYILAEKKAEKEMASRSQTNIHDPVDAFLCGIAPSLKSLNPVLLNETKGKIFSIVQEAELRQLQLNTSNQEKNFMQNCLTSPSQLSAQSSSSSILLNEDVCYQLP